MPTYEYLCADCGKTFETTQKITEEPLTKCELCGGSHVKRLISPTAFHLKGSGWYKTDYASSSSSSSPSSTPSSSSTPASEPAPASKTETKPEPKSESKSETKTTPSGGE